MMDLFAFVVCNFADPSRGRKVTAWKYEILMDGSTRSVAEWSIYVDVFLH